MNDLRIEVHESAESLHEAAAQRIAALVNQALTRQPVFSLSLTGGSAPGPVYELLAREPFRSGVPWQKVRFYFGDERCVPPDSPQSNYRLAADALLDRLPIDGAQVFRMASERPDREAAADEYAAALPERLDLMLLGLGPDGHLCSLFPGGPELRETRRRVVPSRSPRPPHERLSVTRPVIESAVKLIGLVLGERKAEALRLVLDPRTDLEVAPGRLARRALWIVDRAAASRLP